MFEESSRGTNEGNNISFTEEQEGADDNVQDEELIQVQDQVEAQDECCATLVPEDDDVPGCSYSAKLAEDVQESEDEDQDSECTMY